VLIDTTLGAGMVRWYHFSLSQGATDGSGNYLDIDTALSLLNGNNDTMIGLYNSDGQLIASDDDDGPGYTSELSFGQRTPARPALGNGLALDGRDGPLSAGGLYLAVGAYPMTFQPYWNVTSTSTAQGEVKVNFGTNILIPGTCGSADFNHDGDVGTDGDIDSFFRCLAGDCCPTCDSADFNGDGDLGTDADIQSFFSVLGGGPCS
jgi:hypothetical protein